MKSSLPAVVLLLASVGRGGQEDAPAGRKVAIIPIVGGLDNAHVALVKRAGRKVKAEGHALVLFEIDTPGGEITDMIRIGEEMMRLAPIPTVAYVRPPDEGDEIIGGAISAGVYLAISCGRIYMHPGTVMGASAPILMTPEGPEPAGEKGLSMAREKFRARAEQNGYPANLVVAMVDEDLEVFEVEVDGKKRYLTSGEIERLKNEGKRFEVPSVPFDAKGKLLTLTDRKVADTGMGKIAESRRKIYEDLGLTEVTEERIDLSWSENLVAVLTSGLVSFLLLVGAVLGIWVELKTPGFGAAGVIGIACLALLLFGHHLAGLAEVPEILLVFAGLGLVAIEVFLLPGTLIFAVAGAICVFAGLVLSLQDFTLPDPGGAPWQMEIMLGSVGVVLTAFVGAGIAFLGLLRVLPGVPVFRSLVHQAEIAMPATVPPVGNGDLVGRHGHAVTTLRPSGKIEIDGQFYDVVAEGDFVASGEPVEVLRVEGFRIVVGKRER